MLTIAIGSDHRGVKLKRLLQEAVSIEDRTIYWIDVGCFEPDLCDYPIYAHAVVEQMRSGKAELGILLCGSGVGIAIAANRFKGMYAGVAWNEQVAHDAKSDDNINILVLPADYVTGQEAIKITITWLMTTAKGGKYARRVQMIDELTEK